MKTSSLKTSIHKFQKAYAPYYRPQPMTPGVARELGQLLLDIRRHCPYGAWLSVLRSVGLSPTLAYIYMAVASLKKIEFSSCRTVQQAVRCARRKQGTVRKSNGGKP